MNKNNEEHFKDDKLSLEVQEDIKRKMLRGTMGFFHMEFDPIGLMPLSDFFNKSDISKHSKTRIVNCLKRENILLVGDLVKLTKRDVLRIHGINKVSFKEIEKCYFFQMSSFLSMIEQHSLLSSV